MEKYVKPVLYEENVSLPFWRDYERTGDNMGTISGRFGIPASGGWEDQEFYKEQLRKSENGLDLSARDFCGCEDIRIRTSLVRDAATEYPTPCENSIIVVNEISQYSYYRRSFQQAASFRTDVRFCAYVEKVLCSMVCLKEYVREAGADDARFPSSLFNGFLVRNRDIPVAWFKIGHYRFDVLPAPLDDSFYGTGASGRERWLRMEIGGEYLEQFKAVYGEKG